MYLTYYKQQETATVQNLLPIYAQSVLLYNINKKLQICHTQSACFEDMYGPAHHICVLHKGVRIGLGTPI
jgi:hypothetical protein